LIMKFIKQSLSLLLPRCRVLDTAPGTFAAHAVQSTALMAAIVTLAVMVLRCAQSSFAQETQPRTFSAPAEAAQALFQAVDTDSDNERAVEAIVGAGEGVTSPNDEVGENEATALQVCEEFAMAKNAAAAKAASEDPITKFAESLASAAGGMPTTESNPFHGYYFRIVAPNPASGAGARGMRTRGLTLIAYPRGYQSSGIDTFVVTHRGIVFEKDLGPGTTTVAPLMKARTGSSWHPAV
jgi:hypothetical protein